MRISTVRKNKLL